MTTAGENAVSPSVSTSVRPPAGALSRQVNLTRELALTQFKLKYTGSVLGYLWSLMLPLLNFAILWIVFTKLFKVGATSRPAEHFTMQLLVAIIIWSFFAETVGAAVSVIASNGALIKKAYFPRPVLVIASSLSAFMTFLINMILILGIAAPFHQVDLGWQSLLIVPLVAELYLLILGLGLLLSSLFVFYRDLGHIWTVSSQVLFYASAVVYPIKLVPVKPTNWRQLVALNPMAQIIEDVRHAIVSPELPWTASLLGGWRGLAPFAIVALVAATGYLTFRALTPQFAEYL